MIPVEYCHPDSVWFESPRNRAAHDVYGDALPIAAPWTVTVGPDWTMVNHPDVTLPVAGWKVHVSATPANAVDVLTVAAKYCIAERIPFKYIRSPEVLTRRNGKYGSRSGSGKFITIYPPREQLDDVLADLGGQLEGFDGPYILTDVRWRSGPLYVRFGGITPPASRGTDGLIRHLIPDGTGRWIPDSRRPFFRVPDGVEVPESIAGALADRDRNTLADFPYTVVSALHYSNGGGVYLATDDRTGSTVLIREARPLAGIDIGGSDAVDRLHAERDALTALADIDGVPGVLDHRVGVEHHYLIREYVPGNTLEKVASERRSRCTADEYSAWALSTLQAVDALVNRIADRSMTIGDLHAGNFLLDEDDRLHIIDLETASTSPDAVQIQAAIGFVAPADRVGPAIDRYAQGCLSIAVFAPGLPATLAWNSDADSVIDQILTARFDLDDTYSSTLLARLGTTRPTAVPRRIATAAPDAASCTDITGLAVGVAARVHPASTDRRGTDTSRNDRLWAADPAADATPEGPLSVAYGAAGVIGALARAGVDTAEHTDWLLDRTRRGLAGPDDLGWGLYNGLGGVLWTLLDASTADTSAARYGPEVTDALIERFLDADHLRTPLTGALFGGLAGIGLTALRVESHSHAGEFLYLAHDILDRIRETGPGAGPRRGGLMQGASGSAVFAIALGRRLHEPDLFDLATTWIDRDLATLRERPMVPTLAADLGIVLPLVQLLSTSVAPEPIRDRIENVLASMVAHHIPDCAGLFHGWSGVATVLAAARSHGVGDTERLLPTHGPDILRAYSVRVDDHVAVLGSANLRLSDDLATGTAGVIAALTSLAGGASAVPGLDGVTAAPR